jgi:folate-binding protein YgfZ
MVFPPSAVIYPGAPAAWLRISGIDSAAFLQGQFSQDLRGLVPGLPGRPNRAAYGLWLSHRGRVLADSFVLAGADPNEFWVMSTHSPGALIRERLERFIIADDVAVEDRTGEVEGAALVGTGSGDWLAAEPREGWFFPGRRSAGENWEWVFLRSAAAAHTTGGFAAQLGTPAQFGTPAQLERLRIEAGIPAVPADIGPADLPNEGGLDTEAISYTKGCYLGQEVMARVKATGRVRRRLVRVRGAVPPPAQPPQAPPPPSAPATATAASAADSDTTKPVPLWRKGQQVGELRSAIQLPDGQGFLGLALISLAGEETVGPLAWTAGGDAGVEVVGSAGVGLH